MTAVLRNIPRGMAAHVAAVLRGEYDIPGLGGVRTVLDIGANCGAFAVWARNRWPEATVHCYEPWPSNYAALVGNLGPSTGPDAVGWSYTIPLAVVGRSAPEIYLRPGLNNDGEVSEYDLGEQGGGDYFVAPTVRASTLPPCDFLKVDTEGSEVEIITDYLTVHKPAAIAYEWHRLSDRTDLHQTLVRAGYFQLSDTPSHDTKPRGVAKWLLASLL